MPAATSQTAFLEAKIRFTAFHDASFDGGCALSRRRRVEVVISQPNHVLHALKSIVQDDGLVGE